MPTVHHINCGVLHAPPNPRASCHGLLLEGPGGLTLVETGIRLQDVADPTGRIGQTLIDMAGFQFRESDTAVRQIERLGFRAADFPAATVRLSAGCTATAPARWTRSATTTSPSSRSRDPAALPPSFRHGRSVR